MKEPRPGREAWNWADALFMASPTLARLGAITGEEKYFDFLDDMFWDATDFLFNAEEGLYYRDENFVDRRSPHGKKVFWARGNAWVMGGIVRVLQFMPDRHSARARFEKRFKAMAKTVAPLQGEDGFWRAHLLDPEAFPNPETSSTGLFCYALAWGVNEGVLKRGVYEPVVERAWEGMVSAVDADGRLGWVQPVGYKPEPATYDDTHAYGAGAFLLAGSEVLRLEE